MKKDASLNLALRTFKFPSTSLLCFLTFILSISQKFDSILGYFVTKESLTGAGDPFGIRRSTLSIIKICIDKKINLNFSELFDFHKNLYLVQNIN